MVTALNSGSEKMLMATAITTCSVVALSVYYMSRSWLQTDRIWCFLCRRDQKEIDLERSVLDEDDPEFITRHAQFINLNNHRLRIFHSIHELGSKVPLIVFIHGLGGQLLQWQRQLEYFSQTANVLAVDLLGCDQSEVVKDWDAYTTSALVEDVKKLLLERYCHSSTAIVAHSYGCSIASFVAADPEIQKTLCGLVLISPCAKLSASQQRNQKIVGWIPNYLFSFMRVIDRKGGLWSHSVCRFLGDEQRTEIRKCQLRWNLQSRTPVYKRFVFGATFPSKSIYKSIQTHVLLIGGDQDKLTPASNMDIIRQSLLSDDSMSEDNGNDRVPKPYIIPHVGHMAMVVKPELVNPVISDFLIKQCGLTTLSGAWQIMNKTKGENKWDLKNYEKWSRTANITPEPIGPSGFRAMKVMRQTDQEHNPSAFLAKYPEIGFIIDISNDTPPYRTSDFDHSRIEYIKLRTVSKIPPREDEVAQFIALASKCWEHKPDAQIAVHCHYGFNRTGFFICCYLIERLRVSVADAIKYFAEVRPPGIRHTHFIDELYLRYERTKG